MTIAGGCLMPTTNEAGQPPSTLAALRERAGLTQKQVSERMGLSRSRVSDIEALFPNVTFPSVRDYLKALGEDIVFTHETFGTTRADTIQADATRQAAAERRRTHPSRKRS